MTRAEAIAVIDSLPAGDTVARAAILRQVTDPRDRHAVAIYVVYRSVALVAYQAGDLAEALAWDAEADEIRG